MTIQELIKNRIGKAKQPGWPSKYYIELSYTIVYGWKNPIRFMIGNKIRSYHNINKIKKSGWIEYSEIDK